MPPSTPTSSSRVNPSTPSSAAGFSTNLNGSKSIRSKPKAAAPAPTVPVSRIQSRARKSLSTSSPLKPAPTSSRAPGSNNALNTSLSAHPRTDPLNALSVLLKLLTALPGRIGGCQYKLTKDEHALAIHLVGVLDPYVYHGARVLSPAVVSSNNGNSTSVVLRTAGFGLMDQPTEIIDAILSHVESKKDLLSVGLGCKRLYDVVFPRHYEYRVIRCKVSNVEVWNHLVGNRSLARNVRRLEIVDERSSVSSSLSSSSTTAARGAAQPLLIPHGIRQTSSDLESTDDELHLHKKHERYLSAALLRMTGLKELKWACNHSPISIANVWDAIGVRAKGLRMLEVCDNLIFGPGTGNGEDESSEEESASEGEGEKGTSRKGVMVHVPARSLASMETVVFRSTPHSYGASKIPELSRIAAMLNHCTNLKNLEITYVPPRTSTSSHANALAQGAGQGSPTRARPLADDFLASAPRWASLTNITFTNLRCASPTAISGFLSGHDALEVLHFVDVVVQSGLDLAEGSLPRLREIKASRDIITAVIECPLDVKMRRPLEVIKGFKLSGNASTPSSSSTTRVTPDSRFLTNLRNVGSSIRRVEMVGWHDMEDIKRLTACVPIVQWLDIGRRIGGGGGSGGGERDNDLRERTVRDSRTGGGERERSRAAANTNTNASATTSNMLEWTDILATLPELATMHGVRFFYEVSAAAMGSGASTTVQCGGGSASSGSLASLSFSGPGSTSNDNNSSSGHYYYHDSSSLPSALPLLNPNISTMERSRLRKNDEIASLLAWKCPKLRRVDHWEGSACVCGRVIVLLRDGSGAGGSEKEKEMEGGGGKGKGKERERERHGHGGEKEKEKVRWEVRRVKL